MDVKTKPLIGKKSQFTKKLLQRIFLCVIRFTKRCVLDPKERSIINHLILCGKYEVVRTLGKGRFGTVYLARHLSLQVERAIKVFSKSDDLTASYLSEVQLLKSVQHPGIPQIYDIEETAESFYLIEEYVPGESLSTLLLHQHFISPILFYDFCKQLCSIFVYLHALRPNPVLYLDLKPEHIIVCGQQLKLIDFGISTFITNSGNKFQIFGNEAFSAPELRSHHLPSTRADIYSLGRLMEYLSEHVKEPLPKNLYPIIKKSIRSDPAARYETVESLWQEMEFAFSKTGQTHLSLKLAVVGCHNGCGATHLAISLVSALNYLGTPAFYVEKNSSNSLRNAASFLSSFTEQDGYYLYRFFRGIPDYGDGIEVTYPFHQITVIDYGASVHPQDLTDADLIIYICDSAPWHIAKALTKWKDLRFPPEKTLYLANHCNLETACFYAKLFAVPFLLFGWDNDPFRITKEKRKLAKRIINKKGKDL